MRHQQSRGHALSHGIRDAECRACAAKRENVESVSAYGAQGLPLGGELIAIELRQAAQDQFALNLARQVHLAGHGRLVGPPRPPLFQRALELGEQPRIFPGLLDVIAGAALHGLDGKVRAPPRRHDHDRQRVVHRLDLLEQIQAFVSGSRVAGVVQIHQEQVEGTLAQSFQNSRGRICSLGLMTVSLEQQAQGLHDVRLIVGNQRARSRLFTACQGRMLGHRTHARSAFLHGSYFSRTRSTLSH